MPYFKVNLLWGKGELYLIDTKTTQKTWIKRRKRRFIKKPDWKKAWPKILDPLNKQTGVRPTPNNCKTPPPSLKNQKPDRSSTNQAFLKGFFSYSA
jgi:hypothetical protein